MIRFTFSVLLLLIFNSTFASPRDSVNTYTFPDSLRVNGFFAHVNVKQVNSKKELFAGIQTGNVKLSLETDEDKKEIVFEFPKTATVLAKGLDVDADEKGELEWDYNWNVNETYQLYIAAASDSAANFTLYSGYVFLPGQNKWKLIGACKIAGHWGNLKSASTFFSTGKNKPLTVEFNQVWAQRSNGSWKDQINSTSKVPVLAPFSNTDSLQQTQLEENTIQQAIVSGKTDAKNKADDVYYSIIKEGTGRQVLITDTVVVFYKGYLFSDDSVFDQTKETPATFPLNRLIRGWQLGLPQCKVGGKIKLVIPSGLAYSIRTRSPKIPPNSILVFEIEVVDVKR